MSLRVKARAVETVKVIYPLSTIPLEEDLAMASNEGTGTNRSSQTCNPLRFNSAKSDRSWHRALL